MTTNLLEICDRVYHASPAELAVATLVFGIGFGAGLAVAYWIYAYLCTDAECGADDEECAWCERGEARGICPAHSAEMAEQAQEISREEGRV